MMVKFSQERKVRSLAKKTFGSTRVGSVMRFVGVGGRRGAVDIFFGVGEGGRGEVRGGKGGWGTLGGVSWGLKARGLGTGSWWG